MGKVPFQTNMHLSLKKRKKKRKTQYRIKASKTLQTTRAYQLKKKKKTEINAVLF